MQLRAAARARAYAVNVDVHWRRKRTGARRTPAVGMSAAIDLTQLEQFGGGFYDFSIAEGVRSKG
jgi:hypothetical protein